MKFNIEDIFEMEHGLKNYSLVPILDINNQEYIRIIKSFNLNPKYFYKVTGKLHPFCYLNGTVYLEIYEISTNYFENFQVVEFIKQRHIIHDEAIKHKEFMRLFMFIDKPFRFDMYKKLYNTIPDNQKYEVFKGIYTQSEYGFNKLSKDFIKDIYSYVNIKKEWFNQDVITIYRGQGDKSNNYTEAYSWTLKKGIAEKFAFRFNDNGTVYKAKVKQSDILDYFKDEGEEEVLVMPENIFDVEIL